MRYPQQKTVCQLDEDGIFIGTTQADLSPLEAEAGVYLLPANTIDTLPPKPRQGFAAQWQENQWHYVEDHRGKVVYSTENGQAITIHELGALPEQVTETPRPSPHHAFQNGQWEISAEKQAERLKTQQAEMWEKIKQRRYENSLGGVYIERVGKWFQTGEEEKTKYLGLDKVIDRLGEIDWKCADNSFIKMNRTLLDEIFLQMVVTENADHINAEKHRIAMMSVENPLEYDYSSGWAEIYAEGK